MNENTPHKINYIKILNKENGKIGKERIINETRWIGFMKNKYLNDNNNIKLLDNMQIRPQSGLQFKFIRENSNNNIKKHGKNNSSEKISKKEMNLRIENKETYKVKKEKKIKNNFIEKSNEKEIANFNKSQLIEYILSILKEKFIIEKNGEYELKNKTNKLYISKLKESIDKLNHSYLNKENKLLKRSLDDLEKNRVLTKEQFNKIKNNIIKQIQILSVDIKIKKNQH